MKIPCYQLKNQFGKKSGTWQATIEGTGWFSNGKSKQEALDTLRETLKNQNDFSFHRKYLIKNNVTFSLYYAGGWSYDIVRPNQGVSTTCLSVESADEAFKLMENHFNQYEG